MKSVFWKKAVAIMLGAALILGVFQPMSSVQAAANRLSLAQAKKMALADTLLPPPFPL